MTEKPLYSTSKVVQVKSDKKEKVSSLPAKGPFRVQLSRKGRAGKTVTVIDNIPLNENEAKKLMRSLQQKFACGASFKNGEILLNGDFVQEVMRYLKECFNISS